MSKAITISVDESLFEELRSYEEAQARIDAAMAIDDYESAAAAIDQRNKWAGDIAFRLAFRVRPLMSSKARAA